MADTSDQQIIIDEFTGQPDGENLLGCYFILKPGVDVYDFYDKDGQPKGRHIRVGSEFTFELDDVPGIVWHLTLTEDSDNVLRGGWWDGVDPAMADGTYQAQAGGSGEGEPNTTSAYA
ncbi:MAG TPA: hypothetical protein VFI24_04815 [Pyrinomonadaceae bacterium]|nr:hypothetical protein [Pyrinomonadaceae bacterium]